MNRWPLRSLALLLTLVGGLVHAESPAPLPDDSVYHLNSQWLDQDSKSLPLASLAGKQQIVALIYTHCMHSCPTIVAVLQQIERQLPEEVLADTGFVLVSLTPGSDTPATLKTFAEKRQLSPTRWTLLTGDPQDVRALAMALNVRYKRSEDNEVAHSNVFTLLDAEGRIVFQETGDMAKVESAVKRIAGDN